MISKFKLSKDEKTVSWQHAGQAVQLTFQYPVAAHHVVPQHEVLVQSDVRESGPTNLTIYSPDGSVKAQPAMPKLKSPVDGVYAVWFVPNQPQVTVVLLTEASKPYDTACSFDLTTHTFSKCHPTK